MLCVSPKYYFINTKDTSYNIFNTWLSQKYSMLKVDAVCILLLSHSSRCGIEKSIFYLEARMIYAK